MTIGEWLEKERKYILLFCGIFCVVGAFAWYILRPEAQEPELILEMETDPAASESVPASRDTICVYIVGGVGRPGVYELPRGSRVYDAVRAAGDLGPYAAVEDVNLAEPLTDCMKIHIPIDPNRVDTIAAAAAATGERIVNINRADEAELTLLPGIGKVTAGKIIDYRKKHGVFQSKEELKKVPSIGDVKYSRLADRITI